MLPSASRRPTGHHLRGDAEAKGEGDRNERNCQDDDVLPTGTRVRWIADM